MQHMDRGVATVAVWAGVAGLSYLFHSFGMFSGVLSGWAATGMVAAAIVGTMIVWHTA